MMIGCPCCGKTHNVVTHPGIDNLAFGTGSSIGHLLILVNPNSGAGKSPKILRQKLLPKLSATGLTYEIVVTECAGYARTMARNRTDLSRFNAIVILSGDGLIYEIINGIVERADYEKILPNLPIGIVPSGSGNALLASVFHHQRLPLDLKKMLTRSMDLIGSPQAIAHPVNLVHVETPSEQLASFSAVGWGLISDLDYESERWRKLLGSARFTAGAIVRTFALRSNKARLSFLPWQKTDETTPFPKFPVYSRQLNDTDTPILATNLDGDRSKIFRQRHPKGFDLPTLNDPIPASWTTIEDEFILVHSASCSHLSFNCYYAPGVQLNDEKMYLTYILKNDIGSRVDVMKFLARINGRKFHEYPFLKVIPIVAFRLEPLTAGGLIMVDGEVVKTDRLQATVTDLTMAVIGQ